MHDETEDNNQNNYNNSNIITTNVVNVQKPNMQNNMQKNMNSSSIHKHNTMNMNNLSMNMNLNTPEKSDNMNNLFFNLQNNNNNVNNTGVYPTHKTSYDNVSHNLNNNMILNPQSPDAFNPSIGNNTFNNMSINNNNNYNYNTGNTNNINTNTSFNSSRLSNDNVFNTDNTPRNQNTSQNQSNISNSKQPNINVNNMNNMNNINNINNMNNMINSAVKSNASSNSIISETNKSSNYYGSQHNEKVKNEELKYLDDMFTEIKIKHSTVAELQSQINANEKLNNALDKNTVYSKPSIKDVSNLHTSSLPKKNLDDLYGILDDLSPNENNANPNNLINNLEGTESKVNQIHTSIIINVDKVKPQNEEDEDDFRDVEEDAETDNHPRTENQSKISSNTQSQVTTNINNDKKLEMNNLFDNYDAFSNKNYNNKNNNNNNINFSSSKEIEPNLKLSNTNMNQANLNNITQKSNSSNVENTVTKSLDLGNLLDNFTLFDMGISNPIIANQASTNQTSNVLDKSIKIEAQTQVKNDTPINEEDDEFQFCEEDEEVNNNNTVKGKDIVNDNTNNNVKSNFDTKKVDLLSDVMDLDFSTTEKDKIKPIQETITIENKISEVVSNKVENNGDEGIVNC